MEKATSVAFFFFIPIEQPETENTKANMKSHDTPGCSGHDWQPLFNKPCGEEQVREYMTYGYVDFMQCSKCGAVCMMDAPTSRTVPVLSESSAKAKKQRAAVWNAKNAAAEKTASSASCK